MSALYNIWKAEVGSIAAHDDRDGTEFQHWRADKEDHVSHGSKDDEDALIYAAWRAEVGSIAADEDRDGKNFQHWLDRY